MQKLDSILKKPSKRKHFDMCPEIIREHAYFWPIITVYGGSVYLGTTGYGLVIAGLVGSVASIPIGVYGRKIFRYLPNVRYRIGKYQTTGDGDSNYWTVLLRKKLPNFITHPFSHVFKKAPGLEFTIDSDGVNRGSCRLGEIPLTVIGSHENRIKPIGDNDKAGGGVRKKLNILAKVFDDAQLDIRLCIKHNVQYDQLHDVFREKMTEKQYYEYMGLRIFMRDGLVIPSSN